MHRLFILPAALVALVLLARTSVAEPLAPAGKKLAAALDAMHVDQLWLSGGVVDWKTGVTQSTPADGKKHTHCSAFVAAACMRLGVYILRPPEHSATQLANAQYDWLRQEGKKHGWTLVKTAKTAQHLANQGKLVVATFKEVGGQPGHIAIVRPSAKSDEAIAAAGPQIIQAGMHNYTSTSLNQGFKNHPAAWRDGKVRYYVHEVTAY